jgi:hypothetical protein
MPAADVDRFDEVRRAWIAAHQGWSMMQRRRAEALGRRVRARQRAVAAAVPDPHDDTRLPPLWLRTTKSPAAQVEFVLVLVAALTVPIGWSCGVAVKSALVRCIPHRLRGFPVTALFAMGALLAAVAGLGFALATGVPLTTAWVVLQVVVTPLVAGGYGVAEGWLAVPASRRWWPVAPPRRDLTVDDATAVLGFYNTTGPGVLESRRLPRSGERSRP